MKLLSEFGARLFSIFHINAEFELLFVRHWWLNCGFAWDNRTIASVFQGDNPGSKAKDELVGKKILWGENVGETELNQWQEWWKGGGNFRKAFQKQINRQGKVRS